MRRWMPMGLMLMGVIALAVLALPLIEPSLLWVFIDNPGLTLMWDVASVVAAGLFVSGGLWSMARMRRSGRRDYSR
ncbi:hypothetical protein [Brevundimonas goettingensis]|uniref:Uncharacterized protein n=1 Tax=Brevundimonas goettingensis TaxID=2774190 RepID=A0A975BY43_9CAUL|nr:hypothetical protein [Brevundimonas goettingensis]QTC89658.1 hypothetical protein IFJ75_10025 [Brevundimonas goettingensis]